MSNNEATNESAKTAISSSSVVAGGDVNEAREMERADIDGL